MNRDSQHVLDIVESARLIRAYIEDVTRDAFMRDIQLQDSIIRRFEIIGEASGRVSVPFRERHAAIPWSGMIGLRNRMIHGYDAIDLELVWTTAHERIPELLARLEALLPLDIDGPPESEP